MNFEKGSKGEKKIQLPKINRESFLEKELLTWFDYFNPKIIAIGKIHVFDNLNVYVTIDKNYD